MKVYDRFTSIIFHGNLEILDKEQDAIIFQWCNLPEEKGSAEYHDTIRCALDWAHYNVREAAGDRDLQIYWDENKGQACFASEPS